MTSEYAWLRSVYGSVGDARSIYSLARELETENNLHLAATAYDRAYALAPDHKDITDDRKRLLDRLAVVEFGLRFRYIPAGTFLMGSNTGDPDEQPIHPIELDDYWLAETPISWGDYLDLMGWSQDIEFSRGGLAYHPESVYLGPHEEMSWNANFFLREEMKIRYQYCIESNREDPRRPQNIYRKPLICVSWQEAEELCETITTDEYLYRLPTEAEWEKAARGGRSDCLYPWGNEVPDEDRCDFNRFDEFAILPMRRFPPNGYGLYAMSGCVWEWTSDWYDALCYGESPRLNPKGPTSGQEKVLRGGSWADCAEAVTVSFRLSRGSRYWREDEWGGHFSPNIGFRLCRVER